MVEENETRAAAAAAADNILSMTRMTCMVYTVRSVSETRGVTTNSELPSRRRTRLHCPIASISSTLAVTGRTALLDRSNSETQKNIFGDDRRGSNRILLPADSNRRTSRHDIRIIAHFFSTRRSVAAAADARMAKAAHSEKIVRRGRCTDAARRVKSPTVRVLAGGVRCCDADADGRTARRVPFSYVSRQTD